MVSIVVQGVEEEKMYATLTNNNILNELFLIAKRFLGSLD